MGREVARLYAAEGHRVAVTGRRKALLEELLEEFPDRVVARELDVRSMSDSVPLDALADALGGIDVCLYCAGVATVSKTLEWSIEKETTDTNVSGFIRCAEWAFNRFASQGGGHLANISSVASWRGNSHAPAYSASKAFQSVYFEGLLMKARRMGLPIAVTDIQPGFVKTKMAQGNRMFWVADVGKAARQIKAAMDRREFRPYVTRRWSLVAWLMRNLPDALFHRIA